MKNKKVLLSLLSLALLASCGTTSSSSFEETTSQTPSISETTSIEEEHPEIKLENSSKIHELKVGESLSLTATITKTTENEPKATFSSSNDAVATVSENGEIVANGRGFATITASYKDATASYDVIVRDPSSKLAQAENWNSLGYLNSKDHEGFSNVQAYLLRSADLTVFSFVNDSDTWLDESVEILLDLGKNTALAIKDKGIDHINENVFRINLYTLGEGYYTLKQANSEEVFVDLENRDGISVVKHSEARFDIVLNLGVAFKDYMSSQDVFGFALGHWSNVKEEYCAWSFGGYEIPTNRAAAFVRVNSLGEIYLASSNYSSTNMATWLTNSYCEVEGEKAGLGWNLYAIYLKNSFILRWENTDKGWPENSGYGYRLTIQWFKPTGEDWMNFGIMFPGANGDSWFMGDVIIYGRIGLNSYEWEIPYSLVNGFVNVHPFIKITSNTDWSEDGVIAEKIENVYITSKTTQVESYFSTTYTLDQKFFTDGSKGTPFYLEEGETLTTSFNKSTKDIEITESGYYYVKAGNDGAILTSTITDANDKAFAFAKLIEGFEPNGVNSDSLKIMKTAFKILSKSEGGLDALKGMDITSHMSDRTYINAYAKALMIL